MRPWLCAWDAASNRAAWCWKSPRCIGTSWACCGCTSWGCCTSGNRRKWMADQAVMVNPHGEAFEPPLLGTYSKKLGMWLFLLSDSLTFGALLYAYSYGRMSTPGWPTPFDAHSIANASIMTAFLLSSSLTMVLAVLAANRGDRVWSRNWLLA